MNSSVGGDDAHAHLKQLRDEEVPPCPQIMLAIQIALRQRCDVLSVCSGAHQPPLIWTRQTMILLLCGHRAMTKVTGATSIHRQEI